MRRKDEAANESNRSWCTRTLLRSGVVRPTPPSHPKQNSSHRRGRGGNP